MNKLSFPHGGVYLHGDDFRFQDNAYREAFATIYRVFIEEVQGNCILHGCTFIPSNTGQYVFAPGYVMLDYEMRYFPGASFVSFQNITDFYLVADDGYDPAGLEVLASNNSADTYERRHAKIEVSPTTIHKVLLFDASNSNRIDFYIRKNVIEASTSYLITSLVNGWTASGNSPLIYAIKRFDNQVYFRGVLFGGIATPLNYTLLFTLPVPCRPLERQYRIIPYPPTGYMILDIHSNGEVYITDPLGIVNTNAFLDLSQVSFLTT